jgi:hypothetical protein
MPKDSPRWLLISVLGATSACTLHPEIHAETVAVLAAPGHLAAVEVAVPVPSLDDRCEAGDASACRSLAIAYEGAGRQAPDNLHRARWYYSAACGRGDGASCGDAQRLIDEEPTLPATEETATAVAQPPAAPSTRVVGSINVYGGTVYFGPVTNVFVTQPGATP